MKNTDPLMSAKLKSKTHLLNTCFDFFEPFFARLASKFFKTQNFFFKDIKKTQNLMLISIPLGKL